MIRLFSLAILALVITPDIAHAYIDPGVASIILQSMVAVIAAVSATAGLFWHRIKSFFRSEKHVSSLETTSSKDRD
jgi:hypothetical protein